MNSNETLDELQRLNFEDGLWILFAILCFMNVYGDYNEKEYVITHDDLFKDNSNHIFELTLLITLMIYIYFFRRNYKAYEKTSEQDKQLYAIKLLGSSFLIAGILCLIYFQTKQSSFIGSPAI